MPTNPDLMFPRPATLELLASGEISDQLITPKYEKGKPGDPVTTRIVTGGAGLAELKDPKDMVEWSGVVNHVLFSTRIATHYAAVLQSAGHNINSEVVLNAGIVSHLGRRPWDEANWYPEIVSHYQETLAHTNESLGVKMLEDANTTNSILQVVQGLAHGYDTDPAIYQTIEYRLFSLVDHLVTETVHPYEVRMGNIVTSWFMSGTKPTDELTAQVRQVIVNALQNPGDSTPEVIHNNFLALGAQENSDRLTLSRFAELIVEDAHTAKLLKDAGIDITQAGEIPEFTWERILRSCFLQDSEKVGFAQISSTIQQIHDPVDAEHGIPQVRDQALQAAGYNTKKWGYSAMLNRFDNKNGQPTEAFFHDGSTEQNPLLGWSLAIFLANYFNQSKAQ